MLIKKFARHDHVDDLNMVMMTVMMTVMVLMAVMVGVMLMIVMIMAMMRAIIVMVMTNRATLRKLRRCSCGALVTVCTARFEEKIV